MEMGHGEGYAIASWHQNCFAGVLSHENKRLNILVSRSFDGEIIAYVGKKLGIGSVRGSSSRGGKEALKSMIRKVRSGEGAAITVDGPRGPVHQVKSGIISIACHTGTPILPLAAIGDRYWSLRSWDKFRVPKPFSRVIIYYGDPYLLSKDMDARAWEAQKELVAEKLKVIDELAHKQLGMSVTAESAIRGV